MKTQSSKPVLHVAETYFSHQLEGRYTGWPAVFLRMAYCSLECKFCDSVGVWKKGLEFSVEKLIDAFVANNFVNWISQGAHLILTGGSPLMQQQALVHFLRALRDVKVSPRIFVEVETEAFFTPSPEFDRWVHQYNVSPKLASSGMPRDRRIRPNALRWHRIDSRSDFKFPVADEADLAELEKLVEEFNLPHERIVLMPVCDSRESHASASPAVAEWAKDRCWRFSLRGQLAVYDRAVGV